MNREALLRACREEERVAHIHGWDFSHIHGRYSEEDSLPWDYAAEIRARLRPEMRILDMDTGGGEFLLSLNHPCSRTAATEGYAPNVALCRERLLPLGVDFRAAEAGGALPFEGGSFDLVLNRHGSFDAAEIFRVLRPGGAFVTQQVGAENDRELVSLLLTPAPPMPYPEQYLARAEEIFRAAGFAIEKAQEAFRPIRFTDVAALTWFARIIEWEFPGFSVDACAENLLNAQRILEEQGAIEGRIHRFLLIARKEEI